MAKTYTLQATLNTGRLRNSDWVSDAWTNFFYDSDDLVGYSGFDSPRYYATNMLFDQSTLSSLRTKVSNGVSVTGLTLTVQCEQAMTGESYIAYKYNSTESGKSSSAAWARSTNVDNPGSAGDTGDTLAYIIPAQSLSTGQQTFNLYRSDPDSGVARPFSGIPKYGLVAGPRRLVSGRWRFTSATLHVTTNEFTVNYYKGANGTGNNVTDVIVSGGSLRGATLYTRTGYTQTGWSTSDGGAKVYNLSAPYSGPSDVLNLYPYWTAVTYTVTYNKGTADGATGSQQTDTKTYGIDLTLKNAIFTRTGYTQQGWSTASAGDSKAYELGSNGGKYTNNAAITLYPYWVANTYAVTYNGNGGTGTTAAQTKTYGEPLTLRANGFTRTGYAFQHWNTKADGTGATYAAGASYTANAAVTLYAIWQATASTVSTTNGTLDTAQTITITRSNSSYTHNLSYTYGSLTGSIATDVGTSYSWTPPPSLASAFPNATSGVCTITCVTKSGTTTIGTTTTTCTLNIPASIKPSSVSLTAAHYAANTAISGWGVFTRGYSQADLTVAYTLNGGATLSSITFNGPGISFTGTATSKRTNVLTSAGTNTWTVTVTDSRGRATSATVSKTVYDYAPPLISSIEVSRCDSDGTANNGSGAYMKFKPHFSVSSVNGNNGLATSNGAVLKWRVAGGSWSTAFAVTNNTWTSVLGSGLIDITKSYEGQLTVTDKVGNSTTFTVTLPSASGIWYGKGNDRIGLGGVPEGAGLWCDWDATFKGVVDVVPRRCFATLASQGWYRVLKLEGQNFAMGGTAFEIDLVIAREYWSTANEIHSIKFQCAANQYIFSNESSASNSVLVDKIRYVRETNNIGYIDIHYTTSASNGMYVGFTVHNHWQDCFVAMGLASAPDSPSALTIREYTFATNTKQYSSGTSSGVGYVIHRNGNLVQLRIESAGGKACAQGQYTTVYTLPDWAKPYDTVYTAVDTYGGNNVICCMITANGNVQIYPVNSSTGYYRFTVTYFVTL